MEILSYPKNMAEGSGESEGTGTTRRNLLIAGVATFVSALLGKEILKPNVFEEEARKLWDEYEKNPQEFLRKYPNGVIEGLITGQNGVNLRNVPTAQAGKEGIVGYLNPNESIGTALIFPNQKPGPDGPFLTIKKDGRVAFVASNQLIEQKPLNIK